MAKQAAGGPSGDQKQQTASAQSFLRYKTLADRMDRHKTAPIGQVIAWVFDMSGVSPETIQLEDVPSVGALRLLWWVQLNTANYGEFLRTMLSKLIPAKGQLDTDARFNDDGREQLSLLDEYDREHQDRACA